LENFARKRDGGKKMNFTDIDLSTVSASAVAIIPIIIALVQVVKMANWVNDKFAPIIAIVIGVIITMLADHNTADWSNSLLSGVVYGLSASGLYSGVKSTAHAKEDKKEVKK
jgi:hypothetical protein